MTNLFKPGDRVKRIRGSNHIKDGMIRDNIYTVVRQDSNTIWVKEAKEAWDASYFELVTMNNDVYEIF